MRAPREAILVRPSGPLSGRVAISGAKNSVLKVMAATLLAPGTYTIRNVPQIHDVTIMGELLEAMGATVVTADGSKVPVEMGSHGIGVSRLLGAIIEASHDEKGIIWPEGVTPFPVGIVNLKQGDAGTDAACEGLYKALAAKGLEALYDDRDERAGAKFATMDLIGLPWRITVGPRGLANGVVELTSRRTGVSEEMPAEAAMDRIAEIYAAV